VRRLNRWFDGLSNWQFVAAVAVIMLCVIVAADYVIALATRHANTSFDVGYDVVFTAAFTAVLAWKRWKRW
jgi:membrane protein YdbS with pleckstrin-like domain